ncbi:acyltransferase [Leptolyngbya ohadii]|uniref:acyltransferase n=1 Tax=Leptolyngbya ohadii TaxID=1962290 RepID=UPI000B59C0AE|nr:acyltransferase [Leptolyngbya ohadii]
MGLIATSILLFNRYFHALMSRWRNCYYRVLGVRLNGYVWMRNIEVPRNFQEIEIEQGTSLDRGVTLLCSGESSPHPKIQIGENTYINRNTFIDASLSIVIGKECAIGPGCYITDHDHGIDPGLSPLAQPLVSKQTQIGDRSWIGANVTVLKGVTIGADAVIGAGSVVTKDIPERAIAVGSPAKVIRYRQADRTLAAAVSGSDIVESL